jgi:hypothetical protein
MEASGDWEPGPAGQDAVPDPAEQWFYLDTRPLRRAARFLMWTGLAAFAGVVALATLVAMLIPHTALVVILIVLAVPVLLLALATAAAIWVGRRAWRSGAWMELVPMAAGMPWLGRLGWAGRALLVSRAFWRLGRRARRPGGASRRSASVPYQAYPDGPWRQARVGDLSGTTR